MPIGGLLRDLEEGYSQRLTIVIPPGPGWPLPAYELALLIASRRPRHGHGARDHARHSRAGTAGDLRPPRRRARHRRARAAPDVADRARSLRRARSRARRRAILMRPSGATPGRSTASSPSRACAVVPADGVPAGPDGFVTVDAHGRVTGVDAIWAAGDGIDFPVKFGGLAAEQADAVAADIAAGAGANVGTDAVPPRPARPAADRQRPALPALRRRRRRRRGRGGAPHALWWPPAKINGRYLAPWHAALDQERVADYLPRSGALPVQTDLHRDVVA